MRQWYLFYSHQFEFVPQAVAQIAWGHNRLIITKIKDISEAIFYAQATIKNGWGRDNLEIQIDKNYYLKKGNAITNFEKALDLYEKEFRKSPDSNKLFASITNCLANLGVLNNYVK